MLVDLAVSENIDEILRFMSTVRAQSFYCVSLTQKFENMKENHFHSC